MKFYKILNDKLIHYKMKYTEGLNINCEETVFDGKGCRGLFFSDAKNIFHYCDYGTMIAEVELPKDARFMKCNDRRMYKTDKIILKNIRPLWAVDTLEQLRTDGVNIHMENEILLETASRFGKYEIVKYLVETGSDIFANQCNSFIQAASFGCLEIVKFLVFNGVSPTQFNDFALQLAVNGNHLETVKYLVSIGADIHVKNDYLLMLAKKKNYKKIVKFLIIHKSNADIPDKSKN